MPDRYSVDAGLLQEAITLLGNLPARVAGRLLVALEADVRPLEGEEQAAESGSLPTEKAAG